MRVSGVERRDDDLNSLLVFAPIRLDAEAGTLDVLVDETQWRARTVDCPSIAASHSGMGRELFALMRAQAGTAEQGACSLFAHDRDPECAA